MAVRKRAATTPEYREMANHGDGTTTCDPTHLSERVKGLVTARTAQVQIVTSPGTRNRVSLNEADAAPGEIARAEPRIFCQPVEAADAIPLRGPMAINHLRQGSPVYVPRTWRFFTESELTHTVKSRHS